MESTATLTDAFAGAFALIGGADPDLLEIVLLSLGVSVTAVAAAALLGMPLGALLALGRLPGRRILLVIISAAMSLPPVVAGLFVYLLLSRSGPFGVLGLLYTPWAMIIAQCVLVLPIVTALTHQTVRDLWGDYHEQLASLGVFGRRAAATLLWEARFSLVTAVLAGFGRASAEVGAVMIVGGNIDHHTRVMTTAIALETSRGDLALALGLGLILLALAVLVSTGAHLLASRAAPAGAAAP